MTKGTPSMGKRSKLTHVTCRRCGHRSLHSAHRVCSACGFGKSKRLRKFAWQRKKLTETRTK
jgi:large subunit ribosomal protein L37e